jgi:division protein CdvB (Snf7/Vps24/ESCRT-III family)
MEPSALGDDLNEVSVLLNVAHRLLLGIRDDVDIDPSIQSIVDDLNAAHDQLDAVMESIGTALDRVDEQADRPPGQRPAIH